MWKDRCYPPSPAGLTDLIGGSYFIFLAVLLTRVKQIIELQSMCAGFFQPVVLHKWKVSEIAWVEGDLEIIIRVADFKLLLERPRRWIGIFQRNIDTIAFCKSFTGR